MKDIKQTPVGKVLCWLGIHALVVTGGNTYSAWGGCVRCNSGFQWDNPTPSSGCCHE